jgi:hypothetical protein
MEFFQSLSNVSKTALLHIPQQCCQENLNDFVTWVNNWLEPMKFGTVLGSTDGVVDKKNLQLCSTTQAITISYLISC